MELGKALTHCYSTEIKSVLHLFFPLETPSVANAELGEESAGALVRTGYTPWLG